MLALSLSLAFILIVVIVLAYAERKIAAFIQDRMGPMEAGPRGTLQSVLDVVKLLHKEDIVPSGADKLLFKLAPLLIFAAVLAGFAVVPLTSGFVPSGTSLGVFYLLAILSLDVIGLLMAGWGSNNKFAVLGAMRSVAQIVSYEIPAGLAVLCVVMLSQSLDFQEIGLQQGIFAAPETTNYLFGIKALGINVTGMGGFLTWNVLRAPFLFVAFLIYFISSLAESNRAPFDIPEAESELVAGFHTEYSGFRFAALFLAEYAMMLLVCLVAVILFLGSWNTVFPNLGSVKLADWTSGTPGEISGTLWGLFWIMSKTAVLLFVQVAIRWTYPRLRVDQLMRLCWKVLTPAALALVIITAVWRILMVW